MVEENLVHLKNLKKELQKKSIKLTRQREHILRLFLQSSHHLLTAAQIRQMLHKQDCSMDLSTIYRNLETLTTAGIIRHIALNDNLARYELVTEHHHHHLICLGCNRTEVVDLCPFQEINIYVKHHTDFLPTEHRFEIYGYCRECRETHLQEKKPVPNGGQHHDHTGH
jgi:Fe2+ or Zn2+ uptake regulation protein